MTGILRVLYIKCPNWLKYQIGERRFLAIALSLGILLTLIFGSLLVYSDEDSLTIKICTHKAGTFLEILTSYKVNITGIDQYEF